MLYMIGKLNHCDMVSFSDSPRHKQSQARALVNDLGSPVVCVMFVASAHTYYVRCCLSKFVSNGQQKLLLNI